MARKWSPGHKFGLLYEKYLQVWKKTVDSLKGQKRLNMLDESGHMANLGKKIGRFSQNPKIMKKSLTHSALREPSWA